MASIPDSKKTTNCSSYQTILRSQNDYLLKFSFSLESSLQCEARHKKQNHWTTIKSYDLPRNLLNISLLGQWSDYINQERWAIKKLSNGDLKLITLTGLKGGMEDKSKAKQIAYRRAATLLAEDPDYTALVNSLDIALLQVAPQYLNFGERRLIQVRSISAGALGGGAAGGAVGTAVILAMFSNPATAPIASVGLGFAALGSIIGAIVGNRYASSSIETQNKKAEQLAQEVKTIASLPLAEATPLLLSDNPSKRRAGQTKIIDALNDLKEKGYINHLDVNTFELNEQKISDACSHIDANQRGDARTALELTILLVINSAPHDMRPHTALCIKLEALLTKLEHLKDLKAFAHLTLGYLYAKDRRLLDRGEKHFKCIPVDHSLFATRQACLEAIEIKKQKIQKGVTHE